MIRADFHIHSTLSDGSDTVAEIVEKAVKRGLTAIAITDHDTLSLPRQLPRDPRIQVLGGIEISAIDPQTGIKAHVLGYQIEDIETVEKLVAPIRERRHQNSLRQIERLRDHGYEIDLSRLHKADGQYVYKQHIMEYLVKTGQAAEMFGPFYYLVFKHGGYCDFDIRYVDVRDAVAAIHRAGGKAVLAHPGQQQNFYLIAAVPFDGVEYNHMENTPEDKETIMECVRDSSTPLILTGGSDYHGRYGDKLIELGACLSSESGVQCLC
jgi:phosphoribosyl 1,2-cyclic phosphate 1,2-diphosphodiesterase